MTPTNPATPSAPALAAANALYPHFPPLTIQAHARQIDTSTGLPRLLSALRLAVDYLEGRANCNAGMVLFEVKARLAKAEASPELARLNSSPSSTP